MSAEVKRFVRAEANTDDVRAAMRSVLVSIEGAFTNVERLKPRTRLALALSLLSDRESPRIRNLTEPLRQELLRANVDERHYWLSTFYTLLMSANMRRDMATFFTPPAIVHHLIAQTEKAGLDLRTAHVIDPAAGGAAFVSSLAGRMTELGCRAEDIRGRLSGIEIDEHLALLGELLVCDRLSDRFDSGKRSIQVADSLRVGKIAAYDAVFVNPPYGRLLGLGENIPKEWLDFCARNHVNKYALFVDLAFRMAKPGGLVATVTPSSFLAGSLFQNLRAYIRSKAEVVRVDVLERKDVFHDVQQDACVSVFRILTKGSSSASAFKPRLGRIDRNWKFEEVGTITAASTEIKAPWVLPEHDDTDDALRRCTTRLTDYGVTPKAGYFVWNREQDRLHHGKKTGTAYPLFWATNIRPGAPCKPRSKSGVGIDYVSFEKDNPGIIRRSSIVLQRTTNSKQPRRLVAAIIPRQVVKRHKGFVCENHTIALVPHARTNLSLLCKLLNSKAVDKRFRRIGGTSSISISALKDLPLPDPRHLCVAVSRTKDFEKAVEAAYEASSKRKVVDKAA
ncbi:adenine-specific DNA-methyltransferase [Nitrobacteraceae bacterium AZCC 1564]